MHSWVISPPLIGSCFPTFYNKKMFQAGLQLGSNLTRILVRIYKAKKKTTKKQTRDVNDTITSDVTKVESKLTTAHFSAAEEWQTKGERCREVQTVSETAAALN